MAGPELPEWDWEKTDTSRSGSSGDLAKFFKNEGTKTPGVFKKDVISDEATLTAREVIQNSWDAARELQGDLEREGRSHPHFEIEFEFTDLVGQAKTNLVGRLGLDSLHTRLCKSTSGDQISRATIGLPESCALDRLGDDSPLRVLRIIERGASGMYGPFVEDQSKLYLALVSIGYTQKSEGSGGSYGYGKAGLIGASAIRTVVAYTCFEPRDSEPEVTRRFLGMTYWGQHSHNGVSNTGFARFGHYENGWTKPFENEQADDVAVGLGLKPRSPNDLSDLGTTFLVIDPVIEPDELIKAVERNWWPALEENSFIVFATINGTDGNSRRIDAVPRRDPVLQSFISGWELATVSQDVSQLNKIRKPIGSYKSLELGNLGLVAKPDGWSYAQVEIPIEEDSEAESEQDEGSQQSSLVALVRGPKMIVEYLPFYRGRTPFLRGVFVADSDVDDLLRQTEPKAHDSWQTRPRDVEAGTDDLAPRIADEIIRRIRNEVRDFQKKLKPPSPAPEDVNLPEFQKLFKRLLAGDSGQPPPPPPPGDRDLSLRFHKQKLVGVGSGSVRLDAIIGFKLSESFVDSEHALCAIDVNYSYVEDGKKGQECELEIRPPDGFSINESGSFLGEVGREELLFHIKSSSYSSDWSGRLVATGKVVNRSGGTTK